MERVFIWTEPFVDRLFKEFSKKEAELIEGKIEKDLCEDPEAGELIEGTHGIRKLRVSYGNRGKSAGIRVFYLDIKQKEQIYLLVFILKNEKDNLTKSERNVIGKVALKIKKEVENEKTRKKK